MSSKKLMQVSKSPKIHYRMYKSGRHWLFAGVTVVTVGGSLLWGTQARAATTSTSTDEQSVDQTIVNGTASVGSTVPLKQATQSTVSVTGSTVTSGKSQSTTSSTSQVSQTSQSSQATSELSSASQPAESDGKNASSDPGHVTSQVATSESNSVGQSATSGNQSSTASASSDGALSQAKSAVPSQASGVDSQTIDLQSMVSSENKQIDRKNLTNHLMASDVTAGNQLATSRISLLRDATPDDSTFTWSIDDTGTTLTLNGGTPTESLYNMLDDTQRENIKNIIVAKPVTIVGNVGVKFFYGFYNDETITGLENVHVDQATDLSEMFEQLGNYQGKNIQFSGLENWNVSNVTTFYYMFFWAVDENRNVLHDAKTVEDNLAKIAFSEDRPGGGVLTLGGQDEVNSNYKGFGNSLIIELLTGILAQGSLSADTNKGKHDFSQFFMTIDPALFGDLDVLKANATKMFDRIRHLKHLPGTKIMIPGDREYRHYDENLEQGVSIDETTLAEMQAVGDEFGVTVPTEETVED